MKNKFWIFMVKFIFKRLDQAHLTSLIRDVQIYEELIRVVLIKLGKTHKLKYCTFKLFCHEWIRHIITFNIKHKTSLFCSSDVTVPFKILNFFTSPWRSPLNEADIRRKYNMSLKMFNFIFLNIDVILSIYHVNIRIITL